jgi:hypothetical protein
MHTRVRFPSPAFARSFLAGYSAAQSATCLGLTVPFAKGRKRFRFEEFG